MATTKKLEAIASFRLELGKGVNGTIPTWAFGGSTIGALGAGDALAYTSCAPNGISESFQDDSIEGLGFKDIPVQVGKSATVDNFGGNVRYIGMDKLFYWMLGYENGGTSPVDLTGGYYSHLFELDKNERHFVAYRTAEKTAPGQGNYDAKNRFAVLGIKRGTNDFRYPFFICTGFTLSSTAGGPVTWTAKGLAYREDRGDYSSATWTFGAGAADSSSMVLHHQCVVSLGAPGSLSVIGVSDWSVNVDIPLKKSQDTTTGLFIQEPVFEGKYNVTASVTISRHSVDTWIAARDAATTLCMKIVATSGSYGFEAYLPKIVETSAMVADEDVATTPIEFSTGPEPAAGNPFATEIGDHELIQKGNLFIITKNTNDANEMRRE